jgi:SAM-dependent methyltransferase
VGGTDSVNSEDWNRRYAAAELLWSAGPNRFLVAETESLEPGTALDVACGEGRNAVWLADRGWQVTAVDYADVALTKARRRADGLAIELVLADVVAWQPDGVYDLVVVLYLQLPAEEMAAVLCTASAAVAAGGTFLLVGHDLTNLTDGHGGPSSPDVLYTPDDIVDALQGLVVEKAERVLRPVDGADRPAIDCLVRATRPV